MRALVTRTDPVRWTLTDVPAPQPSGTEVLIDVAAVGLNRADLLMRDGTYTPTSADWTVGPDRVGFELAGVVRAVGSRVTGFRPGDRVMAQTGGACAEQVVVDYRLLLPVPDGEPWPQAAALPSALLTEYDALVAIAGLVPGERVLVAGATSGVGLVAVQLARALGASAVVATTRSPTSEPLLRSLGATDVVTTPYAVLPNLPPVDVVLDHVGGPLLPALVPLVAHRGRIVQIGRLAGTTATLDLELLAARRLTLLGTTFRGRTAAELHTLVAQVRTRLPELIRSGPVRAHLDTTFPLTSAEQAAARLASGDSPGKIVLIMG